MVKLKRIYKKPERADGFRILVDRLWPRGVAKAKARINLWLKEIGPSNELRKWFGHDPKRWPAFQKKYRAELKNNKINVAFLKKNLKGKRVVTFLFAAKDEEHNNAIALKRLLDL